MNVDPSVIAKITAEIIAKVVEAEKEANPNTTGIFETMDEAVAAAHKPAPTKAGPVVAETKETNTTGTAAAEQAEGAPARCGARQGCNPLLVGAGNFLGQNLGPFADLAIASLRLSRCRLGGHLGAQNRIIYR